MILQFVLIFCFFHLDILSEESINRTVFLDNSLKQYHEYFGQLNDSPMIYLIGNASGKEKTIIHLDGETWSIYAHQQLDDNIVIQLKKDIKEVLRKHYEETHAFMKEYIAEYEDMKVEIVEIIQEKESDELLMILVSVCYFMLVAYGNLISSEIVYQKNMKVLPIILNNINVKKHFYGYIIYGYLVPLIRIVMFLICLIPNLIIGVNGNEISSLSNMVFQQVDLPEREIALSSLILTFLLLLSMLVIVQIIFLIIGSVMKDNDQIGNFLLIVNIIGLLIYYLCLNNINESFLNKPFVVVLSYFPIISAVLTSGRLLLDCCNIISGIFALSLNIIVIYLLMTRCLKVYKHNLLN